MTIKVTGLKFISYKNKTGNQIEGFEVHAIIIDNNNLDQYEGYPVFKEFIKDIDKPEVNQKYEVIFEISEFNGKRYARTIGLQKI